MRQQGICRIVDASVTISRGEIFWNFFLVRNILSAFGHLNGERVGELLFYLIFAKSLDIICSASSMIPKILHVVWRRSSVGQSRGIIILES